MCRAKTEDQLRHMIHKSEQVRILYSMGMHWDGSDIENKKGICIISYSISKCSNGKPEEEARRMWEDNINVVLKPIRLSGSMDWINLAQNCGK